MNVIIVLTTVGEVPWKIFEKHKKSQSPTDLRFCSTYFHPKNEKICTPLKTSDMHLYIKENTNSAVSRPYTKILRIFMGRCGLLWLIYFVVFFGWKYVEQNPRSGGDWDFLCFSNIFLGTSPKSVRFSLNNIKLFKAHNSQKWDF